MFYKDANSQGRVKVPTGGKFSNKQARERLYLGKGSSR